MSTISKSQSSRFGGNVLALSGGVGGAKLCRGLAEVLLPEQLTIVANTGDDFDYWDLRICPDLDSVMYALADLNDEGRGWGLRDETWLTLSSMRKLGGDDWFQIGDRDLATHLLRTQCLKAGQSLSAATKKMTTGLGIKHNLLPMSEQTVATKVLTDQGYLDFQHYFVREQCRPEVLGLHFDGVESAALNPLVSNILGDDSLAAIVICPSNPFVSIDPILNLPNCRALLKDAAAPVIAVSPIIAGRAVKGPAAKMMQELNMPATALAVATYYGDLLDGFVLDEADAHYLDDIKALGIKACVVPTLMTDMKSKVELADAVLAFATNSAISA
ncbi:2-phospho-L-lactate transferase [Zhongshania aliphaticivorans]|uniref:2-phospho-L-lactate transferase n=1 Tax=Zhongshania aliphaticivorans TaxID=1470434 RepID=A0A5S9MRB4_9GAMM|nr:2-phospho-L-lactate transferase [Zhongshania aliphaticivorans]CAA0079686.1 2-phospho-L-lactate transferase [Zhongshania aliphaticivorans]CAA0086017.1 2-phospho-L-lactate transferase [Zhongshania aliphaticivorans]